MSSLTRTQRLFFAAAFFSGLGFGPFQYLQSLFIAELGATPQQIGQVLGLSGLVGVVLFIPVSQQIDWLGRKRVIIWGWGIGAATTLAMAWAPNWQWYIPALILYRLSSLAMPAFYAYLAETDTEGNPNRLFSLIAAASTIGVVISPLISGWLAEIFGLRAVFSYSALLFSLATVVFLAIPEQALTTRQERLPVQTLVKNRPLMGQMVFLFLFFFVIDLGQIMVPNYLHDVHGVSYLQIGQLGTIGAVGMLLLTIFLGRLSAERQDVLFITQFLALAALLLWLWTPTALGMMAAFFVHGTNRLAVPYANGRIALFLPARMRNLGFGFRETAVRLSFAAGPFVAGWLYGLDPQWPLIISGFGLMIMLVVTFFMPNGRLQTNTARHPSTNR
ncbi:MAG: MFS transporter [Chloroflexota bacterium]